MIHANYKALGRMSHCDLFCGSDLRSCRRWSRTVVPGLEVGGHLEPLSGAPSIAHALSCMARTGVPNTLRCYDLGDHWLLPAVQMGLVVTIFAVNGLDDAAQILIGRFLEGGIGIVAAGAILFYLSRQKVRGAFT